MSDSKTKPTTLYDKIWDDHLVHEADDGTCLLYIDRHLVHEVTSPAGLRRAARHRPQGARAGEDAGRGRPQRPDHRPLQAQSRIRRASSRCAVMAKNAKEFGITYYNEYRQAPGHRPRHRPGAGLHAARHHHRLRRQPHLDAWRVRRAGARHRHLRGRARAGDADADPEEGEEHARRSSTAYCPTASPARTSSWPSSARSARPAAPAMCIEYAGDAIRALSMEGRMTVCNMSIEGGARAGLIAPDEKTFDYLQGPPDAPKGDAWDAAMRYWETLRSRRGRAFRSRDPAGCGQAAADRDLGHLARGRGVDHRRRAGSRQDRRRSQAAARSSARWTTWA